MQFTVGDDADEAGADGDDGDDDDDDEGDEDDGDDDAFVVLLSLYPVVLWIYARWWVFRSHVHTR